MERIKAFFSSAILKKAGLIITAALAASVLLPAESGVSRSAQAALTKPTPLPSALNQIQATPSPTPTATPAPAETSSGPDIAGAKKAILAAYRHYETKVDIRSYNINYVDNKADLRLIMSQVVNSTPGLFYTGNTYTVSRNTKTNQIYYLGLGYSEDYLREPTAKEEKSLDDFHKTTVDDTVYTVDTDTIKADKKTINTKVASIIKNNIFSSMSDEEKALALHDYIISTTSYTNEEDAGSRVKETGVFIDHAANCQGYSLAYAVLCRKVGIKCKIVISTSMEPSHEWNQVRIGKKWYNVDLSWDDPTDDIKKANQNGLVLHENFLCSAEKFTKNGHTGFITKSTSKHDEYDDKYWVDIKSKMHFLPLEGKWIMLVPGTGIVKRSLLTGSIETLYDFSGNGADPQCLIKQKDSRYYLISYGNIYLFDADEKDAQCIWKISDNFPGYAVKQLKYSKGKLYYRISNGTLLTGGKLLVSKSTGELLD
ncbi:MAG: transglutaminase domain-containing protein [Lachnospiraceae bacterium]|jgi:transglutaminase-like putative cysteine protease|nr:transglutaminase domain-containing protein [Lachnospiraceae bacterium]MEE3461539.1 transglutaminase domain-containing protein [Lachnospiraceae bacterium]